MVREKAAERPMPADSLDAAIVRLTIAFGKDNPDDLTWLLRQVAREAATMSDSSNNDFPVRTDGFGVAAHPEA